MTIGRTTTRPRDAGYLRRGLRRRSRRLFRLLGGWTGLAFAVARRRAVRPRVCIWATVFQTEILVLAHALVDGGAADVLVVAADLPTYLQQPIARIRPLKCRMLARDDWRTPFRIRRFGADVVIIDDLFPDQRVAPRLVCMWHGLGMWKAKPRDELLRFVSDAAPHVGKISDASGRLLAHCYGATSQEWWTREWGIPPQCCRQMGMPYSDWILQPPYDRVTARSILRLPETVGPIVALALSWHYGDRFGKWGGLRAIAEQTLAWVRRHRGQLILCMHDRGHFDPSVIAALEELIATAPDICFQPRDRHPDNLPALLAADLMVSNYSSLLCYFYLIGRPSIHLDPRPGEGLMPPVASYASGYRDLLEPRPDDVQMHSYDDNGGLMTRDSADLEAALEFAIRMPECCRERARQFLDRNVVGLDGASGARMANEILSWVRGPDRAV